MAPIKPKGSTPLLIVGVLLLVGGGISLVAGSQLPETVEVEGTSSAKASVKQEAPKPELVEVTFDPNQYDSILTKLQEEDAAEASEAASKAEKARIRRRKAAEARRQKELEEQKARNEKSEEYYLDVDKNPEAAREDLTLKDCDNTGELDGDQCNDLGLKFFRNSELDKRFLPHARELFRVACQRRSPPGCSNHAIMAERGMGGPRRLDDAREYYSTACNYNHDESCYRLGEFAYEGIGKDEDLKEAYLSFKKSCRLQNSLGCFRQAEMARKGEGTAQDFAVARTSYARACELTSSNALGRDACSRAASMYEGGMGGEKDLDKAEEYYQYACAHGDKNACEKVQ